MIRTVSASRFEAASDLLVIERGGEREGFVEVEAGTRRPEIEGRGLVARGGRGRLRGEAAVNRLVEFLAERSPGLVGTVPQPLQKILVNIHGGAHL